MSLFTVYDGKIGDVETQTPDPSIRSDSAIKYHSLNNELSLREQTELWDYASVFLLGQLLSIVSIPPSPLDVISDKITLSVAVLLFS